MAQLSLDAKSPKHSLSPKSSSGRMTGNTEVMPRAAQPSSSIYEIGLSQRAPDIAARGIACVKTEGHTGAHVRVAFGLRVSHLQFTPSGGERAVSVLMFG